MNNQVHTFSWVVTLIQMTFRNIELWHNDDNGGHYKVKFSDYV